MVNQRLRLSFLSNTLVEKCTYFSGSVHGFQFRAFITIIDLTNEEVGQFGMCLYFVLPMLFLLQIELTPYI